MRSDLTRGPREGGHVDSRTRECSNGSPRCEYAVAPGDNPLGLCDLHLEEHRARVGLPAPAVCPACGTGPMVLVGGALRVVPGAMCFACGIANGGTVASPQHRREARGKMIARIAVLLEPDAPRGAEWAALLARCPPDVRERAERRLATVIPAENAAK